MRRIILAFALLLLAPHAHTQPDAPPPLGGPLLAYTTADADALLIYDLSTRLTRRLSFGDGAHTVWDFSPDGCRVLFTRTEPGAPSQVYSAGLDGSGVRALVDVTELPAALWDAWEPDWSPDGERIALTLSRETEAGREARVGWIPAEGGPPTFYSVAGDEHTPRWSPSGDWLAYIAYEERPAGATIYATAEPSLTADAPRLREADLWIVSANGLTKERITRFDVGSAARPRWSPDSELIGFTYSPQPGDNQLWMIAAAPEAIPTQLSYTWHQALDMTWHPSGEQLILAARDFRGELTARLWSVPLAGNADETARPAFDVGELGTAPADFPRYSPSGEWLALRSGYAVVLVTLETGEVQRLTGVGNTPPVWSPGAFAGEDAC